MSSIDDFREWLNSKDPKVVRSLVLDAYSSDRKFLRAFEKVVDAGFSSATGKSWAQLFSAAHDWDYTKNATYLLESNYWDSGSRLTLVGILHIIACRLNINWKSDLDPINNPKPDSQESTNSSTQKAYQKEREESHTSHNALIHWAKWLEQINHTDQVSQTVDNHIYQRHSSHDPQRRDPAISYKSKTTDSPTSELTWVAVAFLSLIFGGAMIIESTQTSTDYYQEEQSKGSSTTGYNSSQETNTHDHTSLQELSAARQLYDQAVLVCEHERVIMKLNTIKNVTKNPNYQAAAAEIIDKSNQRISFLKQDGKHGLYKEDYKCDHGFQWFDTDTENSSRAFLAVSQKCNTSSMQFEFEEQATGKVVKTITLNTSHLKGSFGEILVPHQNFNVDTWIIPGDFSCNE